jgi:hypothetical protein
MTWGDISQLQTHGIDVLDAMSRATGKTKEALRDMAGHGGIPAKDAIDSLTKGIEMNPLYKGGMAKQAASLSGILSTMSGYLKKALNSFLGLQDGMVLTGGIVDRVKGLFQGLATAVSSDAFQNFVSGAGAGIGNTLGWIGDRLSNAVSPPLKFVTDSFKSSAFQNFASSVGNKISNIFGRIGAVLSNDLGPPLKKIVDYFQTGFSRFATSVGQKLIGVFSTIGSFLEVNVRPHLRAVMAYLESPALKNFASGVGQKIIDVFAGMGKFLETKVNPPLMAFVGYVQNTIVPVLQTWGHNVQVWVIDRFNALKTFIDTQVMPNLSSFWNYIQTQIIPVLITWGGNIKTYVIDKFNALKTFIETQIIPKLQEFWNYITTQIVPKLQEWGNTIKLWVIDKFNDLKVYIETVVIPKLQEFKTFVETKIIPLFTSWGDEIGDVRTNFDNLKVYIETQVMPTLMGVWAFISGLFSPIFQALGDVVKNNVAPHFGDFKTSTDHLKESLGHLWEKISGPVLGILAILGFSAGSEVKGQFDGLKNAIKGAGTVIDWMLTGMTKSIDGLAMWINWIVIAIGSVNDLSTAINNVSPGTWFANVTGIARKPAAGPTGPNALPKPGAVGSFASGIENFGGGLAFVHANELLVNLPKGTSVWNPAKTAQFMQGLKIPAPALASSAVIPSSVSNRSNPVIHVHNHNHINGKEMSDDTATRIIRNARTTGPIRSNLS